MQKNISDIIEYKRNAPCRVNAVITVRKDALIAKLAAQFTTIYDTTLMHIIHEPLYNTPQQHIKPEVAMELAIPRTGVGYIYHNHQQSQQYII